MGQNWRCRWVWQKHKYFNVYLSSKFSHSIFFIFVCLNKPGITSIFYDYNVRSRGQRCWSTCQRGQYELEWTRLDVMKKTTQNGGKFITGDAWEAILNDSVPDRSKVIYIHVYCRNVTDFSSKKIVLLSYLYLCLLWKFQGIFV